MKQTEPNRPGGPGKHRQPKGNQGEKQEHFRVTVEEKQLIQRAAKYVKYSKTLWFKELVLTAAKSLLHKHEGHS